MTHYLSYARASRDYPSSAKERRQTGQAARFHLPANQHVARSVTGLSVGLAQQAFDRGHHGGQALPLLILDQAGVHIDLSPASARLARQHRRVVVSNKDGSGRCMNRFRLPSG